MILELIIDAGVLVVGFLGGRAVQAAYQRSLVEPEPEPKPQPLNPVMEHLCRLLQDSTDGSMQVERPDKGTVRYKLRFGTAEFVVYRAFEDPHWGMTFPIVGRLNSAEADAFRSALETYVIRTAPVLTGGEGPATPRK